MTEEPNYEELSLVLEQTQLMLHASEAHGLISGIVCGMIEEDIAWKKAVIGDKESKEIHEVLEQLFASSEKKLREFLFEFQLMLPSDSQSLSDRAQALTLWCQGFLTGLKLAKVQIEHHQSNEVNDALRDIIEIAKMNYEDVIENEEDETAYVELVEYVRMAVIFLYQELHEEEKLNNKSIH